MHPTSNTASTFSIVTLIFTRYGTQPMLIEAALAGLRDGLAAGQVA